MHAFWKIVGDAALHTPPLAFPAHHTPADALFASFYCQSHGVATIHFVGYKFSPFT